MEPPTLDDLISRLERERLHADRAYHDALAAVDRAVRPAAPAAPPAPPYDTERLHAINQAWDILPGGPPLVDRSWRGRLRGFVWRLVGPSLDRQRQFNASVVDHLNRNAEGHRAARAALAGVCDALARELDALSAFQSRVVQYMLTVTAYVDTKDRSLSVAELRDAVLLAQERTLALKRDLDALRGSAGAAPGHAGATAPQPAHRGVASDTAAYLRFEDRFRGSRDEILRRLADYVALFSGARDVLDLGCGRGEMLELLRDHGVSGRGVDANPDMVRVCRERGLAAEAGDALAVLEAQPEASLGGLAAIQVVEHFEPAYLVRVLDAAHRALRPGAAIALETINPACWLAFFEAYLRDPTHVRPLHPDTLSHLVQASGFVGVDVRYRSEVREADRLARLPAAAAAAAGPAGEVLNQHADALNARLFSFADYAVIARR